MHRIGATAGLFVAGSAIEAFGPRGFMITASLAQGVIVMLTTGFTAGATTSSNTIWL